MLILLAIGFVAGIVTALSPCVLPVLPIVLAGGATGRRPLAIVAGIVASFTVFTLFAAWLLDRLGLPQDLLRNLAIALLFLVALTLLVPQVGELVARPLQALTRRRAGDLGGGFFLGASLGLVFVPCAGPVLAAVSVIAANREVGLEGVLLTLAYAIGAALPMLAIAFAGQRAAGALRAQRCRRPPHGRRARRRRRARDGARGRPGAPDPGSRLHRVAAGPVRALVGRAARAARADRRPRAARRDRRRRGRARGLRPRARSSAASRSWLNSEPLTLADLRGRVVLIDFWTYSCINCLRTLPYLREWDDRYRGAGLTIVGVHSPEFAFERVEANVRETTRELGLRYPVALDNDFATWEAWHNQYWPAKYLIDRDGHVRYYHFGEGEYAETEETIRTLLGESAPAGRRASRTRARTACVTPESYLGYERIARNGGDTVSAGRRARRTGCRRSSATTSSRSAAAGASRTSAPSRAGTRALRLDYRARDVFLVLTGNGKVRVLVDGKPERMVRVRRRPALHAGRAAAQSATTCSSSASTPGVAAYAFTFG